MKINEKFDKDSVTPGLLQEEIEDQIAKKLKAYEKELNIIWDGRYKIEFSAYRDMFVYVMPFEECQKRNTQERKDIEEVIKCLNGIYNGRYVFNFDLERK